MNCNKNLKPNFLTEIAQYVFTNKYARYNEWVGRRETWNESVDRVEAMHLGRFKNRLTPDQLKEIKHAFDFVREKKTVPSMRSMQFGGPAVLAHQARIYNCAVRHIDSPRAFAEVFYLLLCGCGVGLGVTKYFIDRLPDLVDKTDKNGTVVTYIVQDDIEGWADSVEALLNCYLRNTAYSGRKIVFDYSKIRPEGAPIQTGGGKAPGYKGLKAAHKKIKELLDYIIEHNHQTRLKPVNVYDILMHCSDAVLSGGIRRSATCAIFDKTDDEMINAKTRFSVTKYQHFQQKNDKEWEGIVYVDGKYGGFKNHKYEVTLLNFEYEELKKHKLISWHHIEPQRARSNNSVLLLRNDTSFSEFLNINNKTRQYGEPGFVFADHPHQLFNPCFEIGMIPITSGGVCGVQFCNLTSVNGGKIKTKEDFLAAVTAATVIGTLQASYTDFKYLSNAAKEITEAEALLGVSITGMMDNPQILLDADIQREGAQLAAEVNRKWATLLGIKPAARITCIKPEGTSSLVLECSSGIHPHHSRKYFRRVQCNKIDPVYQFFKQKNPHMCEESVWSANKTDDVITFPIEVAQHVKVKEDLNALDHLEIVKSTQKNWVLPSAVNNQKPVSHNVSCTIIVADTEWENVFRYIYDNRDFFAAVSFLPKIGDKIYKQAPNEAISTPEDEQQWDMLIQKYIPVDYTELRESEDRTALIENAACAGGKCDLTFS